jgi:hypothetical protein
VWVPKTCANATARPGHTGRLVKVAGLRWTIILVPVGHPRHARRHRPHHRRRHQHRARICRWEPRRRDNRAARHNLHPKISTSRTARATTSAMRKIETNSVNVSLLTVIMAGATLTLLIRSAPGGLPHVATEEFWWPRTIFQFL